MAKIEVETLGHSDRYEFKVTVYEGRSKTQHRVALDKTDYERLAAGRASPEELVKASFRFLLEREPKESILRSFNLTVISRYFPEYERELTKRL